MRGNAGTPRLTNVTAHVSRLVNCRGNLIADRLPDDQRGVAEVCFDVDIYDNCLPIIGALPTKSNEPRIFYRNIRQELLPFLVPDPQI